MAKRRRRAPHPPESPVKVSGGSRPKRRPNKTLSVREERFVDAYLANGGNGTRAGITAGYTAKSAGVRACQLLKREKIRAALQSRMANDELVATRNERQRFWTAVMRREIGLAEGTTPPDLKDRLAASKLLAMSQADFVERKEISGPGGGAVKIDGSTVEMARYRLTTLLGSRVAKKDELAAASSAPVGDSPLPSTGVAAEEGVEDEGCSQAPLDDAHTEPSPAGSALPSAPSIASPSVNGPGVAQGSPITAIPGPQLPCITLPDMEGVN